MAVKPVVYDDTTKKHRPLGSGEKMDGLSASSIVSSQSGNLITTGSDGLAYATGSGIADPAADNLLEATSGGKLKVDIDRVIEWIDGHPSDAKTISEAIKVVSGDSGNVIVKGSDKGAYLSSAPLASALADGETIVASNGKLAANPMSATAVQHSLSRASDIAENGNFGVPAYVVGSGSLLVWLDGVLCIPGESYSETGTSGQPSSQIKFLQRVPASMAVSVRVN